MDGDGEGTVSRICGAADRRLHLPAPARRRADDRRATPRRPRRGRRGRSGRGGWHRAAAPGATALPPGTPRGRPRPSEASTGSTARRRWTTGRSDRPIGTASSARPASTSMITCRRVASSRTVGGTRSNDIDSIVRSDPSMSPDSAARRGVERPDEELQQRILRWSRERSDALRQRDEASSCHCVRGPRRHPRRE